MPTIQMYLRVSDFARGARVAREGEDYSRAAYWRDIFLEGLAVREKDGLVGPPVGPGRPRTPVDKTDLLTALKLYDELHLKKARLIPLTSEETRRYDVAFKILTKQHLLDPFTNGPKGFRFKPFVPATPSDEMPPKERKAAQARYVVALADVAAWEKEIEALAANLA